MLRKCWRLQLVSGKLHNKATTTTTKSISYLFGISMAIFKALICHAKVGHFANIVVIEENVSGRKVTMDDLPGDKDP